MTLQTEHVHRHNFEQPRIGRTVRCVATAAALSLHRHVFIDERSLLVDMALVADRIATRQRPRLPQNPCPMRIVAVIALHQAFVDAVMIGLGKVRLGSGMASVAQLRLILDQQVLFFLRMMRRVAIKAANIAVGVRGFRKMRLRMILTMAGQTPSACLLSRTTFEHENLGLVASARHVLGARPMATLAALVRWSAFGVKRCLPVRSLFPTVIDFFVAGLAGLRADILRYLGGGLCWRGGLCRLTVTGLGVLVGDLLTSLARGGDNREKTQPREQKKSRDSAANFLAHKFEDPRFRLNLSHERQAPFHRAKPHKHRFDHSENTQILE
jgi:hypothetical protein